MSTAPSWLAWLPHRPQGAHAATSVRSLDGANVGWLAGWISPDRPHSDARRIDPAALDSDGPPAAVSLVWPVRTRWPLFDDPTVVHAIRLAATAPHLTTMSTFTADATHFAGSLLATDASLVGRWPGWWSVDPFARLGPRHCLLIDHGLLASRVAVLGPGTQRRAGAPWPATW